MSVRLKPLIFTHYKEVLIFSSFYPNLEERRLNPAQSIKKPPTFLLVVFCVSPGA